MADLRVARGDARWVAAIAATTVIGLAAGWAPRASGDPLPPAPEANSVFGHPLLPPALPDSTRRRYEQQLAVARNDFDHDPHDVSAIIWLGRRLAYLGRFREALAVYSKGIEEHPDEPRLYRHRGHRYITLRLFDLAISDLEHASRLMAKRMDESEPDGLPNARNIPTSTLKFNITYHLGLAYYLSGDFRAARNTWRECLAVSTNPDMLCATSHWLYMTLRRLGRDGEARALLKPIRGDLDVIENRSYQRLLLMYKGELPMDSLLAVGSSDTSVVEDPSIGYGVGNWLKYNNQTIEAVRVFSRVLAGPQWPAFGHIASEVELKRFRDNLERR